MFKVRAYGSNHLGGATLPARIDRAPIRFESIRHEHYLTQSLIHRCGSLCSIGSTAPSLPLLRISASRDRTDLRMSTRTRMGPKSTTRTRNAPTGETTALRILHVNSFSRTHPEDFSIGTTP